MEQALVTDPFDLQKASCNIKKATTYLVLF
jgi:hypothetical protein